MQFSRAFNRTPSFALRCSTRVQVVIQRAFSHLSKCGQAKMIIPQNCYTLLIVLLIRIEFRTLERAHKNSGIIKSTTQIKVLKYFKVNFSIPSETIC